MQKIRILQPQNKKTVASQCERGHFFSYLIFILFRLFGDRAIWNAQPHWAFRSLNTP